MADVNKTEESAKKLEIEMLRKMGIDVVLDKDEFNRVLKANEKLQKMELELSELSKLSRELNSLKEEKKTVNENNQKLKEDSIERGKRNFAEFIEAAKAMKEFIPSSKEFNPELRGSRFQPFWYDVNRIKVPVEKNISDPNNATFDEITKGTFIFLAKRIDDSIVCISKSNTDDANIYYDENTNTVDEQHKPWYLYENFANSNHISELKTAIKEDLEKRIGTTKEQLDKAHKDLHEAEKAVKNTNLLSENQNTEPAEPKKIDNSLSITTDEFLELSRSIDSKDFEKFADKIQAGSAEYWTYLACIQIEEYNTKQLKWILENRLFRFDEIKRNDALNEKVIEEANTVMNLPQWAAVSDDPAIIDTVYSKMTEDDFTWAKESGVFKKAEEFYNEKFVENPEERNSSVSFDSLKNWVKQYSPESFSENKPVHYYARQVPPEEQYYDIDEELTELEISIIETYAGSRYSEIINNDIPNGSMSQFADTMNEITNDFDTFFQNGGKPSEQDLEDGRAQYASLEEEVNTELPKKDGSKYTEEEMKEWRNVFERYSKTNATHEVLTQVMELQTGEKFVKVSLKGSSQGEDVTAVIPEKLYTEEFVEDIEAKYWNEGVEYLVFEDDSGKIRSLEDLQEHDVFEDDSVSFYLPSYKSAERLAVALGAKKGELTVYDFEGYEKTPKYEKVQYMKTLTNPLDDLRTVLKAYEYGFDNEYNLDDYDEDRVTKGKWSIATGGYDQAWELYYENIPVASCGTDNILIGNNNNSFTGFTEADMLRVVTQEYRNVKCPEIVPPTVEDYEQYLNDYFHDGSFTLEPENAFDEYPFESLLNKNLERHYHYERDSVGGVILSYDDSNHTEYLQPGDDANTFLDEVEKIENGVIQVNAEEQLDNFINNYFPDFFPDNFRDEDTKTFITQQEIIEAVNNFECGKLYREIDPEGFAKDAQEWIEKDSPAFTNVSELPQFMNNKNHESEKIRDICSAALKETAQPMIEVPYSNKNYSNIFKSGYLETPVESIKMGEGQFVKLATPDRNFTLGAVYETLTNPSIVLEEKRYDEELEQNKPYHLYAKSFVMETSGNKKVVQSLIVAKDDKNIVVGAYPRNISDFMSEMTTAGEIIYADKNVSRVASAFSKGVTQDIEWEVISSPTNPKYDESKLLSIPKLAEEGKITTGKLEVTSDNFNEYYNYLIRNKKYQNNSEKVTADIIKYYVKPENIESVVNLSKENGFVSSDWKYNPKKTQFMTNTQDEIDMYKKNSLHINSNGQVLGFVKDNKIYINIDSFNAETPIHEYTHLWDKAVQKTNPELWKQGVELLKKTDTWKDIERNPAYADIAGDEDLLASEVHARLAGKEGAELFRNISDEVRKNVGTVLYDLRKELAEEFCSDRINCVQPYRDDLKRIHDTNFAGINFEVSAKKWTPIRIQQKCEEICDKLGLEYMDATSNFPREDGTVLSNDTYFVNLSVSGFRNLPLQHVISSDEIKLAAYKWNEGSWNYIRDNFTEWKEGNLKSVKELSVKDFVNITLKDFVDGKNPVPHTEGVAQENIQMQYERKTHNEYTDFDSLIYVPTSNELLQEERKDVEKNLLEKASQIISETFDEPSLAKRAKLYVPSDYGYEEDNKIHILVEFDNEAEREDDLFNALAERHMVLANGKEVDFNPIKPEKSGTIEQYLESLERIKENRYQRRKEDNLANIIVTTDNFREVFNKISKLPKFKDKPLEAAGWCIARIPKEKREEVGKWLSSLNGPKKKDVNNLFDKWNKENNPKPAVNKSKSNEKDDWSISD